VYDRQLHQKTIEDFLLNKVIEKMEEATPEDTRWYRSNAMLGCREEADSKAAVVKKKKTAVVKKAAGKKKGKKASGDEGASAGSSSSSSSSSSKKNAKKPKTEEAKTKDE